MTCSGNTSKKLKVPKRKTIVGLEPTKSEESGNSGKDRNKYDEPLQPLQYQSFRL